MTNEQIAQRAYHIREGILSMLEEAGSGHSAGPLGLADIFATLYFRVLDYDPKRPDWPQRDRLVLSCGHTCPVLYATLAEAGYFPRKELLTLRKFGTRLQGHPHVGETPGVENSSGPLGQGLSQAIGMALAAKLDGDKHRVYAILSDGEHQEGQIWEAVMFAGNRHINNLVVTIDRNNIQIDGPTETIMPLEPLAEKYRAFNWHVIEVDGHNIQALSDAYAEAKAIAERPVCVIAHTIPGKGVSYMENDYRWHGIPPDLQDVSGAPPKGKQLEAALGELHAYEAALTHENA
jgi:transketolase